MQVPSTNVTVLQAVPQAPNLLASCGKSFIAAEETRTRSKQTQAATSLSQKVFERWSLQAKPFVQHTLPLWLLFLHKAWIYSLRPHLPTLPKRPCFCKLELLFTGLHKAKLKEVVVLLLLYSSGAMQGNQGLILSLCLTWLPTYPLMNILKPLSCKASHRKKEGVLICFVSSPPVLAGSPLDLQVPQCSGQRGTAGQHLHHAKYENHSEVPNNS